MTQSEFSVSAKKSNSVDGAKQIDELCDRFESQWRAGKRPRIEDFLAAAPEELRAPLFEALLPVELELLAKKGRAPAQADYRKRFPQQAGVITRVFRECA